MKESHRVGADATPADESTFGLVPKDVRARMIAGDVVAAGPGLFPSLNMVDGEWLLSADVGKTFGVSEQFSAAWIAEFDPPDSDSDAVAHVLHTLIGGPK